MVTVLKMVESASNPGDFHEIRIGRDNVTYCTCASWRFSKLSPKDCKHLRDFRAELQVLQPSIRRGRLRRTA